jgi:prepilin-type N-terminal cleavage/methylation domain-containing protein
MKKVRLGFTLVEVLVVMGLLSMTVGLVVSNYQRTSKRQAVDGAAQTLRQAFIDARSNALAGKKDEATCSVYNYALDGWWVNVNTTASPVTYSVYGSCGGLQFPSPVVEQSLPAGVTVTAGVSQILFRPLNRGTDLAASTNFVVSSSDGSYTFSVSPKGELVVPTTTPFVPPPTLPPGCLIHGDACYSPSQCCSNSCSGGSCQ